MNEHSIIINHDEDNTPRKVAYAIYAMYIASFIFPVLLIVGVVFAYLYENDANDYLRSHYQYLIRSFWISLLYFTLAGLSFLIIIGIILIPLALVWWLIRTIKGLKSLLQNKPIDKPKTWLF